MSPLRQTGAGWLKMLVCSSLLLLVATLWSQLQAFKAAVSDVQAFFVLGFALQATYNKEGPQY